MSFGFNQLAQRSLEKKKADLKSVGDAEIARLQATLGQAAEAYKLELKKKEWLFDKELESAKAFLTFKNAWVPLAPSASVDMEDVAPIVLEKSDTIEEQFRHFITSYAPVLPSALRAELVDAYKRFVDGVAQYDADQESFHDPQSSGLDVVSAFADDCSRISGLLFTLVRD